MHSTYIYVYVNAAYYIVQYTVHCRVHARNIVIPLNIEHTVN